MPAEHLSQWCPPVAVIDALELVRRGVLPSQMALGEAPGPAETVEIVDPEGVPLAVASVSTSHGGGRSIRSVDAWLGHRSSRPFERLHRSPAQLPGPAPVLLTSAGSDVAEVVRASVPGARVVLLGSVGGDGTGSVTDAIRELEGALARPAAALVVVAADPTDDAVADAVGVAYAHGGPVTDLRGGAARAKVRGAVVLFTGLSGSGKSTIAKAVRDRLVETTDVGLTLLDGDEVRRHLSAGLSFSVADRETNIRRIGWVAAEIAHHGGLVLCSPIAPFASTRAEVRGYVEGRGGRFVLVHVATPLEECERRDRKGLYARARAGLIPDFTGISSPYETPDDADLVIDTTDLSIDEARDRVLDLLTTTLPVVR